MADAQTHPDPTLAAAIATFQSQKQLAERAITQLSDDLLHESLHRETNSIAVIMKHLAGNMISRWTDFLTTDGEKPNRNRDDEFVDDFSSRDDLDEYWQRGWTCLFETLDGLAGDDLLRTVEIRGEPLTVLLAIDRQLSHYGYHVGQIVMIARILAGENWATLTIPRGQSEEYNRRAWKK